MSNFCKECISSNFLPSGIEGQCKTHDIKDFRYVYIYTRLPDSDTGIRNLDLRIARMKDLKVGNIFSYVLPKCETPVTKRHFYRVTEGPFPSPNCEGLGVIGKSVNPDTFEDLD